MPTITEIQTYLEKNHRADLEDKIPDKVRNRVYRKQAESVKSNKPLPQGQCNLCSRPDERLVPVTMRVCLTCVGKFMKRGGEIKVLQKMPGEYICDFCLSRTFVTLYVNPVVCKYCSTKIGRTHRYHTDERKTVEKKIQKSRERRMIQ